MRNKAAPIRKADYDESAFISDYTFLEEAARSIRASTRLRRYTPGLDDKPVASDARAKGRMTLLAREAAIRHVDLRFLPLSFSRHRRNSTFVRVKEKSLSADPNVVSTSPSRKIVPSSHYYRDAPDDARRSVKRPKCHTENGREIKGDGNKTKVAEFPADSESLPDRHDLYFKPVNYFDSTRILFWTLDLYLDADGDQRHVRVDSVNEHTVIHTLLQGAVSKLHRKRGSSVLTGEHFELHFEELINAIAEGDVCVFMRNEYMLAARSDVVHLPKQPFKNSEKADRFVDPFSEIRKFSEVAIDSQLCDVLYGKCIVEFPVFHVARKNSAVAAVLKRACSGVFDRADDVSLSEGDHIRPHHTLKVRREPLDCVSTGKGLNENSEDWNGCDISKIEGAEPDDDEADGGNDLRIQSGRDIGGSTMNASSENGLENSTGKGKGIGKGMGMGKGIGLPGKGKAIIGKTSVKSGNETENSDYEESKNRASSNDDDDDDDGDDDGDNSGDNDGNDDDVEDSGNDSDNSDGSDSSDDSDGSDGSAGSVGSAGSAGIAGGAGSDHSDGSDSCDSSDGGGGDDDDISNEAGDEDNVGDQSHFPLRIEKHSEDGNFSSKGDNIADECEDDSSDEVDDNESGDDNAGNADGDSDDDREDDDDDEDGDENMADVNDNGRDVTSDIGEEFVTTNKLRKGGCQKRRGQTSATEDVEESRTKRARLASSFELQA